MKDKSYNNKNNHESEFSTESEKKLENSTELIKENDIVNNLLEEENDIKPNKKNLIISLTVLAVLIFGIMCFVFILGLNNNLDISPVNIVINPVNIAIDSKDGYTYFVPMHGEIVKFEGHTSNEIYSIDHSKLLFHDDDKTLYAFYEDKIIEVEKEVNSYTISSNGDTVAYSIETDDSEFELYVYDIKSNKKTLISKKIIASGEYNQRASFVLSPNGKQIGFVSDFNDDKDKFYGYSCAVGEEAKKIGKNLLPIAITDNADIVYYIKLDFGNSKVDIYVKTKEEDNKLISNHENFFLSFNNDLTQVFFSCDGNTYLSEKGGNKVKISKGNLELNEFNNIGYSERELIFSDSYYKITGFSDFKNELFNNEYDGDNNLYIITDNLETKKIIRDIDDKSYVVSHDGKSILYINNSELDYIKDISKADDKSTYDGLDDIVSIVADGDLNNIYFENSDDELFYFNGNKSVKVGEKPENMIINKSTGILYYINNEELFLVNKGKVKKISTSGKVTFLYTVGDIVYYFTNLDSEISEFYRSINGNEFKLISDFSIIILG